MLMFYQMERVKMTTVTASTPTVPTTIRIVLPVSLAFVLVLLLIIVAVCISYYLIYKRRQSTSLSNLTKPHKESEENSYASSEHSREFNLKQSDTPDPGYDVIKMVNSKEVALKSLQVDIHSSKSSRKENPSKNDDVPLYSTVCSSDSDPHKTARSNILSPSSGEYHKRESNNYSNDDNHSNKSSNEINLKEEIEGSELDDETNEPHTYSVIHFKVRDRQSEQENKVLQDANEVLQTPIQKHSYSSYDEAPSIPPHTVEMMYTAVQKRHKDSVETEDKGDAPPIPPYTGEEYHTAGT